MPTADKEFLIRVRADINQALAEMRALNKEVTQQGKGYSTTSKSAKGYGGSLTTLTTALSAYLTVATLVKGLKLADDFNSLQTRLSTATKATGDYNKVSEETYAISQRTGSALDDTVSTFQRLSIARAELGATNTEILTVTESIQQLGVLSGASAEAMKAGQLQFAQAMAAGVVRAEEMNSIIENMPAVAERIARGMNMTVGELRNAVVEGQVLSRDVFDSLLTQAPEISQAFESVPLNLERSTTKLGNSMGRFLSQLDQSISATSTLIGLIDKVSQSLDNWSAYYDENGPARFNLLVEKRLELEERIAAISDTSNNRTRRNLVRLKQQLAEVIAEIERIQNVQISDAKSKTNEVENPPAKPPQPIDDKEFKARRKLIDQIETQVKSLETEAATYGMTRQEVALYRLELEGATQAQLSRAEASLASIAADEDFESAVRASEQAVKDENAAYQEWMKGQQQYLESVIRSVDPTYELTHELERLATLMETFPANADTIAEAMLNVHDAMDQAKNKAEEAADGMSLSAEEAAKRIQGALGDELYNLMQGNFDSIGDAFASMLQRMAAELAAAQIMKMLADLGESISSSGGGSSSNIWADLFAAFASTQNHSGGLAGQGATRMVSPLAFVSAPRFHSGGLPGIAANEVPVILEKGEEVLTRDDPRHVMNGGGGSVKVTNNFNLSGQVDKRTMDQIAATVGRTTARAMRRNT
jgi:tape measure domain-containing protein